MSRIDPALARARELLDRFILFDGHNDLPYTIRRSADGDSPRIRTLDLVP